MTNSDEARRFVSQGGCFGDKTVAAPFHEHAHSRHEHAPPFQEHASTLERVRLYKP